MIKTSIWFASSLHHSPAKGLVKRSNLSRAYLGEADFAVRQGLPEHRPLFVGDLVAEAAAAVDDWYA